MEEWIRVFSSFYSGRWSLPMVEKGEVQDGNGFLVGNISKHLYECGPGEKIFINSVHHIGWNSVLLFKHILFIYLFLENREGRKKERETSMCERKKCPSVASGMPPVGDLTHNAGMCPVWKWNWWSFGLQAGTQSTELYQPGSILPL